MPGALDIHVKIWKMPCEVPDPIAFDQDTKHASYDPEYANRFWRILVLTDEIFKEFRVALYRQEQPGPFLLGQLRSCGHALLRPTAPAREGADPITQEAYSHEVISAGFWPGGGDIKDAAFYVYAAPEPAGFAEAHIGPAKAFYHPQMHEFFLMYDDVRNASSPKAALLEFLETHLRCGCEPRKMESRRTGEACGLSTHVARTPRPGRAKRGNRSVLGDVCAGWTLAPLLVNSNFRHPFARNTLPTDLRRLELPLSRGLQSPLRKILARSSRIEFRKHHFAR